MRRRIEAVAKVGFFPLSLARFTRNSFRLRGARREPRTVACAVWLRSYCLTASLETHGLISIHDVRCRNAFTALIRLAEPVCRLYRSVMGGPSLINGSFGNDIGVAIMLSHPNVGICSWGTSRPLGDSTRQGCVNLDSPTPFSPSLI